MSYKSFCCPSSEKNQTTDSALHHHIESTSSYSPPTQQTQNNVPQKTSRRGLREGWTRVTFILREEHVEKLKAISYWDRVTIKEIIDEALSNYLGDKATKALKR